MKRYRIPIILAVLLVVWLAFGSRIIDLVTSRLWYSEGLPAGVTLEGRLFYTQGFEGIWQVDMRTGEASQWWQPPDGGLVKGVAASPDGSQLAIVYAPPAEEGFQIGTTDLFISPIDAPDLQPLLVREFRNESFRYATWSPDGEWIYYAHQNPLLNDEGGVTGFDLTGERIAANSADVQTPEVVLEDVEQLALSPDGQQIAYLQLDTVTYDQGLWIVNHDGADSRELVAPGTYRLMSSPIFSPDGASVLFSASAIEEGGVVSGNGGLQVAQAHGGPWNIWQITLDDGTMTSLTPETLDGPWTTWSPDANALAVIAAEGVFLVHEDRFYHLTDVTTEGEIAWAR